MKIYLKIFIVLFAILLLAACSSTTPQPTQEPVTPQVEVPEQEEVEAEEGGDELMLAADGFTKGGCGACHVIPGIKNAAGTIGPDLSEIGQTARQQLTNTDYKGKAENVVEYLREAMFDPNAHLSSDCPGGTCPTGLMPSYADSNLNEAEIDAMINFMARLPGLEFSTPIETEEPAEVVETGLADEDMDWAKQVYFERCAGCHGTLRKGATGPALTPDLMQPKGTLALAAIIFNGTPRGMPDWGNQGFMTKEETEIMAEYLQIEPPQPPEMSLDQMLASWKLLVPPEDRPTEPQTSRNWENYMAVTLRDAGQIAVIDADTYEVVANVDTGYAVHITRNSATGRYLYTIGRDGKLALVDLWSEIPTKVAEAQLCYDARSVETSKYSGELGDFTDKLAIVGCYWPPHFVILDGETLEPFKIVSTRSYTWDTEEYHPEPRVAAIVASHFKPEWIVNIKETGQVWMVNYSDPVNPTIKMIEAERFLHDGGWDSTKRYFMVAANNMNTIVVVDALEGKLEALVEVAGIPHPGRGANWIDPEFGPVWSASHLGEGVITSIGTDPVNYPENAWKVVRTTKLPGSGSLFIKTHPNSPWIWVDMTLNPDPATSRTICVVAKESPEEVYKCWEAATYGRAVHFEYNMQGTEVWVSIWGNADIPGEVGEIVVYDDKTLEEVARIPNLVTPTGKFNVYNTIYDIY
jgi:nitrite reductase (NO-forming)/hydroxylamine reductase